MNREAYDFYIKSDLWKARRSGRLKIDGYRCALCRAKDNLNVHHLSYQNLGFENARFELITVCEECHKRIHSFDGTPMEERTCERLLQIANRNYQSFMDYQAHAFCRKYEDMDLSNVGIGKLNLCNYKVIEPIFTAFIDIDGLSVTHMMTIQSFFFMRKRYKVILNYMKKGYTRSKICSITKFNYNSVNKVFNNPEQAEKVVNGEIARINIRKEKDYEDH